MAEAKMLRDASLIERALELERAAGRTPAENMTLDEALEVLERHGEDAPDLALGRSKPLSPPLPT